MLTSLEASNTVPPVDWGVTLKPRRIDRPEPCFLETRLVKGGPAVAARIFLPCPWVQPHPDIDPHEWCRAYDRSRRLQAEVAGKAADLDRIWATGKFVDEARYAYLAATMEWAAQHAPAAPEASPRQRVDVAALPPPF